MRASPRAVAVVAVAVVISRRFRDDFAVDRAFFTPPSPDARLSGALTPLPPSPRPSANPTHSASSDRSNFSSRPPNVPFGSSF